MLDLAGFPHILQQIIASSDRPTLSVLLRVSSSVRDTALPILYTNPLPDPFAPYPSGSAVMNDPASRPSDSPNQLPVRLPAERVKCKIESFLSSPHLALAKQISITHPGILAGHLHRLQQSPKPALRAEGTTTVIWVKPFVPGLEKSVRVDSEGNVIVKKEKKKKGKGAAELPSAEIGTASKGKKARGGWDAIEPNHSRPGQKEFKQIFDIATLLPSTHLVLYLPPSSGVHLQAIINAACLDYDNPQSVRKLTIICGSGNITALYSTSPIESRSWDSVELVLAPPSSGRFKWLALTQTGRGESQVGGEVVDPVPLGMSFDFYTFLAQPVLTLGPTAEYVVIGLEEMGVSELQLETLKEVVGNITRMYNATVKVSYLNLEGWKKGVSEDLARLVSPSNSEGGSTVG